MKKHIKLLIIFLAALSILVFAISGCASEQQNQQPQTQEEEDKEETVDETSEEPEVQEVPEEDVEVETESHQVSFEADGEITEGEYKNTEVFDAVTVYWSSDEEYLYMAMSAETQGYISIGFDPTEMMKDADMVFGYVEDGVVTVLDLYSTGNFGPHPPDTELGGSDDIIESGGKEENGLTVIEFKRLLVTGDEMDNDLDSGSVNIIWATGNADDLDRSHSNRGKGEIEIE